MLTFNSHSGAAYAHSGNARLGVIPLTRWDETNTDHVKIPSAIKFGPEGEIWGIDAKHLPDALRWFKLLLVKEADLDEEIRTSKQLQDARAAAQASGKSAVEVISIFLKCMFQYAVEKLKTARGADMVESSRFHVVLTVPAIWPEYARRRMQQAVDLAGILKTRPVGATSSEFVSEPEAAALATLSTLSGQPNIQVRKPDSRLNEFTNYVHRPVTPLLSSTVAVGPSILSLTRSSRPIP